MAILKNRVRCSTASTGTGAVTPGSALSGFRTFAAAGYATGDSFPLLIEVPGGAWEISTGTLQSDGTIIRVLDDSSTGALLNLAGVAGTTVAVSLSASIASAFISAGSAAAAYSGALPSNTTLGLIVVNGVAYTATQAQIATWAGTVATATSATISGAPSTGTVGSAISGLTNTLTPSNATAYTSLIIAGTEQTPRTPTSGTSLASLTPLTAGTATISIWAAASGGSALATSASITISATPATSGTIGVPLGTPTVGQVSTFSVTADHYPCWASITQGGAEQTPRTQVNSSSSIGMTPAAAGASTASLYAASTGGSAIATTGSSFTVAAGQTITVATITAPTASTAYTVSGTYANGTPAALDYSSDNAATWTAAASPTIATGSYSFQAAGLAAGTYTIKVRDHTNTGVVGTSNSFTVAAVGGTGVAALVPAGGSTLFVLDTSNITGHLYTDAAVTTQAAAGGAVRGIKDRNGGSLNFTAPAGGFGGYAGDAGSLVASQLNGYPSLRFDGNCVFGETAATIRTAITNGSYVTIFAISRQNAGDTNAIWGAGNTNTDEQVYLWNLNGGGAVQVHAEKAGTAADMSVGSSGSWSGNPAVSIVTFHAVASTGNMTVDSKPFTTGATRGQASLAIPAFSTTWANTFIGGCTRFGSGAARMMQGDYFVYAAFASPAAPTSAERDAFYTYATSRWALT